MQRKVEYSAKAGPFATVSIIIHEEGNERLLVIELNHGSKIVFRGDDIAAFHDALHECENVVPNLEMTLRAAAATNAEQSDPAPDEAAPLSDMALNILSEMATGLRVIDAGHAARVRYEESSGCIPREPLDELEAHRLVRVVEQNADNAIVHWGISIAGSAFLAAQEPDEAEGDDQFTIGDAECSILGHMVDGGTLYCKNAKGTFHLEREDTASVYEGHMATLLDNLLIEPRNPPTVSAGLTYYAITAKGRAFLAAQEPDDD